MFEGLLWWLSGKEPACQCRRHGFDPWVGTIPWRRKWQPAPLFLPEKLHGQSSVASYSPLGRKPVRYDWARADTHTHPHTHTHSCLKVVFYQRWDNPAILKLVDLALEKLCNQLFEENITLKGKRTWCSLWLFKSLLCFTIWSRFPSHFNSPWVLKTYQSYPYFSS